MSNIAGELNQLNDIVEKLLRNFPKYRDSDRMLCARIWTGQMGGFEDIKKKSVFEFFLEYVKEDGRLYSQESIGRARRKLQEENVDLRGKKYRERQNHQGDVKGALGY